MIGAGSNQTQQCQGLQDLCCSSLMWIICGVSGALLLVSLSCNVLCCAQSYRRGNTSKFLPRFQRSFSFKSEEVEDNPVYGNINYLYTGMERGNIAQTIENDKLKRQICYAKLQLAPLGTQQGRNKSKTQYTDIMNVLSSSHVENQAANGNPGPWKDSTQSTSLSPANLHLLDLEPSDLYASVRLVERGEKDWRGQYANKESLKIQ
ncbi:uncharacterized protein [Narcine bancroftii]|uniref:uncharacterized protein n=1 Tax=Narcine bancroftii TaxID=1343680 RepID=UPI003831A724